MITLRIQNRKVKVRSFKDISVREYFEMGCKPEVLKCIAIQSGIKIEYLMACNMNHIVTNRINNIDLNSFHCEQIKYKGSKYDDFQNIVYGIHYTAETFIREKKDNHPLWIFAIALNYKITRNFNTFEIEQVYNDLIKMKAINVVPVMNYFIVGFYKKKAFTMKNLIAFIRISHQIVRELVRILWSSIMRKFNYKR